MTPSLHDILRSLNLPTPSRKIYAELLTHGETPARLLSERLMLTRPTTYDHLALLKKRGLIVERVVNGKTYFAVDDPQSIEMLFEDSIQNLKDQRDSFHKILPRLTTSSFTGSPTIKFFEGSEGLTHLMNDILWSGTKDVMTLWPYTEMLRVLGEESLIRFNERRVASKIKLRSLWPHAVKHIRKNHIWSTHDLYTERRMVPKGIAWEMGYSIYGDKVSFISSQNEMYGFIVSSKDFANLMRMHFNVLWQMSHQ